MRSFVTALTQKKLDACFLHQWRRNLAATGLPIPADAIPIALPSTHKRSRFCFFTEDDPEDSNAVLLQMAGFHSKVGMWAPDWELCDTKRKTRSMQIKLLGPDRCMELTQHNIRGGSIGVIVHYDDFKAHAAVKVASGAEHRFKKVDPEDPDSTEVDDDDANLDSWAIAFITFVPKP
jgi:hypothetical protein